MPNDDQVPDIILSQKPKLPVFLIVGLLVLILIAIGAFISRQLPVKHTPVPTPSPVPASATPNPHIPTLVFNCPVAKNLCNKGEQINFNDNPALGYSLPAGTKVLRIAPVTSSKKVGNTLHEAFIFQNKDCYLISYSLPNSGEFSTKFSPPYQRMETIGTTSSLILQLQKFSLDQSNDSKSCDLIRREPKDFGSYQNVTPQIFQ